MPAMPFKTPSSNNPFHQPSAMALSAAWYNHPNARSTASMGASDHAYTAWKIPKNTKVKMAYPQTGWVKMRSMRVVRSEASSHGNSGPLGMSDSALLRMCSMRQPASSSCKAADDSSSCARAASSAMV